VPRDCVPLIDCRRNIFEVAELVEYDKTREFPGRVYLEVGLVLRWSTGMHRDIFE
jgi:hypothetical protein